MLCEEPVGAPTPQFMPIYAGAQLISSYEEY
jgi:hypothetical protein